MPKKVKVSDVKTGQDHFSCCLVGSVISGDGETDQCHLTLILTAPTQTDYPLKNQKMQWRQKKASERKYWA